MNELEFTAKMLKRASAAFDGLAWSIRSLQSAGRFYCLRCNRRWRPTRAEQKRHRHPPDWFPVYRDGRAPFSLFRPERRCVCGSAWAHEGSAGATSYPR